MTTIHGSGYVADMNRDEPRSWTANTHAVDALLIALDRVARDYDYYEYGLPISTEDGRLIEYTVSGELEKMRDVVRAFYAEGFRAGMDRAAAICASRVMGDNNREDAEAKRCEEAIRAEIPPTTSKRRIVPYQVHRQEWETKGR